MSSPINRNDLIMGQPRTDADARVECTRIEWGARIVIALIVFAGVVVTTVGTVLWHVLG